MKFAGRAVVISEADPVPRSMRVRPGVLVLTRAEANGITRGDTVVLGRIQKAIDAHDRRRLLQALTARS